MGPGSKHIPKLYRTFFSVFFSILLLLEGKLANLLRRKRFCFYKQYFINSFRDTLTKIH